MVILFNAELFATLGLPCGTYSHIRDADGKLHYGIIQAIEREDGSGRSFNVRLHDGTFIRTIYVRTCG
jgi:hypothetical protein